MTGLSAEWLFCHIVSSFAVLWLESFMSLPRLERGRSALLGSGGVKVQDSDFHVFTYTATSHGDCSE